MFDQLKHRAKGDTRSAPCPPDLTQLLHDHLSRHGTDSEGRLFRGVRSGRELEESTYHRVWRKARHAALTAEEYASPLGRRPYDLRHAAVSTWLNAGYRLPRLLSGQGTASRSCSRPTRSASQGRRIWRGSGSRPRCTRRSPRCTTWARIGHGQPLSTGFCWTQPDTPRGPCDLIQPGHRVFGVVDMGAPGGIRTHTAALLRDLPLPVGLRGRSPRVTVPPDGGSRTRSVDAVHRAAGAPPRPIKEEARSRLGRSPGAGRRPAWPG